MRIIVGGVFSLEPFSPGRAWHRLHYMLGLRDLGHEVYYVEEIDPASIEGVFADSRRRRAFVLNMREVGLSEQAFQIVGDEVLGISRSKLEAIARQTDLLINMSGHIKHNLILENVRRRAYLDQDPVYTQLWNVEYQHDLDFDRHDVFLTRGLNIGTPYSHIPAAEIEWKQVIPPVVLRYWRPAFDERCERFTTLATFTGYADLEYQGEWYRSKYSEIERFVSLPERADQAFEIALKAFRDESRHIRSLRRHGWIVSEGSAIDTLAEYQDYIGKSRAEIGIAKGAYVKGNSGWFSERSAHYLAAGKPVLAQSTGFERHIPTGDGLMSFTDIDDAAAAIEAINADYERHCMAARQVAEDYLDHRKVLPQTLEACVG